MTEINMSEMIDEFLDELKFTLQEVLERKAQQKL